MVSFVIGVPAFLSRNPTLSKYAIFPLRATTITAPGIWPLSTSLLNVDVMWARRSGEKPTCSGRADGRGWPQTTAAERTRAVETASARTLFMGPPPANQAGMGRMLLQRGGA